MITDPHNVFQCFTPAGFDQIEYESKQHLHYQTKIIAKTYNELNNKYKELKLLQERLRSASTTEDDLKQLFM
jgi:hypothetical protein